MFFGSDCTQIREFSWSGVNGLDKPTTTTVPLATFLSFSRFPILNAGSVLFEASFHFNFILPAGSFLFPDGSVFENFDWAWLIVYVWWLVSRVHCPHLVLFYFILGVFAPQKPDRP